MRTNSTINMKLISALLLLLAFSSNLYASNLCDASCDISITFPDGGSIEAAEALSITFGDGGYINNGVVITGYSAGDVLSLSAGESIDFQNNGSFETGSGGNVDYADIMIITNGTMDLAAVEGSETISIQDMTILGRAAVTISSNVEVAENGTFYVFSGPVSISSDLVFTNNGSVSGSFEFESATLSLGNDSFDFSGPVLIEVDGPLSITSRSGVIGSPTAASVIVSVPSDDADTSGASEMLSASETSEETIVSRTSEEVPASGLQEAQAASGGSLNLPALFIALLLLITNRIVRRKQRIVES